MLSENLIIPIIYLLGSAQGIFLAISLVTSKGGNKKANIYLGALTLTFAAALLDYFMDDTNLTQSMTPLRTFLWPKEFLYGVFIYFYVREMTHPGEYILKGKQWLHFLLPIVHMAITWPILLLQPELQLQILSNSDSLEGSNKILGFILDDVELFFTVIQLTTYLILCFNLLRLHAQDIKQTFSYTEKISLNWLKSLLAGIFLVYLIWLFDEFFSDNSSPLSTLRVMLASSMVILIYSMGYMGLRQPLIFSGKTPANNQKGQEDKKNNNSTAQAKQVDLTDNIKKYKNSPLSQELRLALFKELLAIMETEKPFLNAKLNLPSLAELMKIPHGYLSQVINEEGGKNFFDFINEYRINESKKLIAHPTRKQTILDVAMDAGFSSKSAFYNAFKKHTKMTPTEYKKQLQIQPPSM
ncbi:MAG: helix-turn-helix domain-containing protein [bacterium]